MSTDELRHKNVFRNEWLRVLKSGIDADTWGQSLEAVDEYETLEKSLTAGLRALPLSADERSVVSKIRQSLRFRTRCLQSLNKSGLTLEEMKMLPDVIEELFVCAPGEMGRIASHFPIMLSDYGAISEGKDDSLVDTSASKTLAGSLCPPLTVSETGTTTVSIRIDKIGLKDAETYLEPRMTVSVVDLFGHIVGPQQDTPPSTRLNPNYVWFENTVHLQTPVNAFADGWAVFFEFKHFKPKKDKISTRCFAFMEVDEFVGKEDRQMVLELYKKPTDFTKKRIRLFTAKKLFLHITVMLHKH